MIAAYQRISRADGDLGKDGKDKSNSIENQKELIQRYISCKESLQNVPVMQSTGKKYADHAATLRSWSARKKKQQKPGTGIPDYTYSKEESL